MYLHAIAALCNATRSVSVRSSCLNYYRHSRIFIRHCGASQLKNCWPVPQTKRGSVYPNVKKIRTKKYKEIGGPIQFSIENNIGPLPLIQSEHQKRRRLSSSTPHFFSSIYIRYKIQQLREDKLISSSKCIDPRQTVHQQKRRKKYDCVTSYHYL